MGNRIDCERLRADAMLDTALLTFYERGFGVVSRIK